MNFKEFIYAPYIIGKLQFKVIPNHCLIIFLMIYIKGCTFHSHYYSLFNIRWHMNPNFFGAKPGGIHTLYGDVPPKWVVFFTRNSQKWVCFIEKKPLDMGQFFQNVSNFGYFHPKFLNNNRVDDFALTTQLMHLDIPFVKLKLFDDLGLLSCYYQFLFLTLNSKF